MLNVFSGVSCLQPRNDPADAGNVYLDDRASAALQKTAHFAIGSDTTSPTFFRTARMFWS
jgi:hypothetical protein